MKYRMYVDEVGNSDLGSSDNPNHRFLSLTGVIIDIEYVRKKIFPEIESMKDEYFDSHPDNPVILHRKEIINAKPPFSALKNEKLRKKFDHKLLNYLNKWNYSVISICLDKKSHKETYTTWRFDPYHYCLALLLERFAFFLEQKSEKGDVIAESRGGKEDRRLKDSFAGLWENGTDYVSQERFQNVQTSKQLKVKPKSNNISGLQIADIVAHPSRNEILRENGLLNKQIAPFALKVIAILQKKYYQYGNNIYGKKFL